MCICVCRATEGADAGSYFAPPQVCMIYVYIHICIYMYIYVGVYVCVCVRSCGCARENVCICVCHATEGADAGSYFAPPRECMIYVYIHIFIYM